MAISRKQIDKNYEIIGVFSSATNYLADLNKSSAEEGMVYYDTTENQLKQYDGTSWSNVGMNTASANSLDGVANIGAKITLDFSTAGVEIEATDTYVTANGALLLLDNDDTGSDVHCLELTNAGSAPSIQITGTSGDDIQGTSDTWAVTTAGAADFTAVYLNDSEYIYLGTSDDLTLSFVDGSPGTAGKGLCVQGSGAHEQVCLGDATYQVDLFLTGTTTSNYALWDASADALLLDNCDIHLGDSDILKFGDATAGDVSITWNASNLLIEAATEDTGAIHFGATNAIDTVFYDSTAAKTATFDVSEHMLILDGWHMRLGDSEYLGFGDGDDVYIAWNSSDLLIEAYTQDTGKIKIGTTNAIDLQIYDNGSNLIAFDVSTAILEVNGWDVRLQDDDYLLLGDSATAGSTTDGTIRWDATSSVIEIIGPTQFENNMQVDGNLTLSGTFTHTGAYAPGSLSLGDDEALNLGDSNDVVIDYDSSAADVQINGAAANQGIDFGGATVVDVRFSGATTNYDVQWDASRNMLLFLDSANLGFGGTNDSAADYTLTTAGSTGDLILKMTTANDCFTIGDGTTAADFKIENATNSACNIWWDHSAQTLYLGVNNKGIDTKFFTETASSYILVDQSQDAMIFAAAVACFNDSTECHFGTGASAGAGDWRIYSDGADLFIKEVSAGDKEVDFGADDTGIDVKFFGATTSICMLWDQSADGLLIGDVTKFCVGGSVASPDLQISSDGTNVTQKIDADMTFSCTSANDAIIFGDGNFGMDVQMCGTADSSAIVMFDASGDSGNGQVLFGADDHGVDVEFYGATTSVNVTWDQSANAWLFGADNYGVDVTFYGATTSINAGWDESEDTFELSDNCTLGIGATSAPYDLEIVSDGTNVTQTINDDMTFASTAANDVIIFGDGNFGIDIKFSNTVDSSAPVLWDASDPQWEFGADDHGVDVIFYGATTSIAVTWDQSEDTLEIGDNATLGFGATSAPYDLEIVSDGTNVTQTINSDMTFASTAATDTIIIGDGSFGVDFKFSNTVDSSAPVLWDASDPQWEFGADDHGVDVIFYGATTSINATWDQSEDTFELSDNCTLGVGATSAPYDLEIVSDGTNVKQTINSDMTFASTAATDAIIFGDGNYGLDVKFTSSADSSAGVHWDASGDSGNGQWMFGQTDGHGVDVIFRGATTDKNITWDQSADRLTATEAGITAALGDAEDGLVLPTKAGAATVTTATAGAIVVDTTNSALCVATSTGTWVTVALT
jgi:hypothetical protein